MSGNNGWRSSENREWVPRVQRFLVGTSAVALSIQSVYLVIISPATDFEPSVVTPYPLPFWICFGVSIAALVLVFWLSAIGSSPYWRHAFVLLFVNYALYFALPIVRDYKLYGRGDKLYHLGKTKELIATGSLPGGLFYPHEHILLAELSGFGLSVETASIVLPFVLTMLFVFSVGLAVRTLTTDQRGLVTGLAAATPLLFTQFHVQLQPAILSFFLFPLLILVVELIRRTANWRYVVLLVPLGFATVVFHPVNGLLLAVLVGSTAVFGYLYQFGGATRTRPLDLAHVFPILVVTFTWYIGFERTKRAVLRILLASTGTPAVKQAQLASGAELSLWQLGMRFVQLYGAIFLYLGVAALFVLFVVVKRSDEYAEQFAVGQFGVGFAIAVSFLGTYLIESNPVRVSRYMILMAVVLVALLSLRLVSSVGRGHGRRIVALIVCCSLVAAAVLGAFTVYRPNYHLTHGEYQGIEFMLENGDHDYPLYAFQLDTRTQDYVLGGTSTAGPVPAFVSSTAFISGLGYETNRTALQSFGRSYVITKEYDRKWHTAAYFTPEQRQARRLYSDGDLARMNGDPTVAKVYENGGFEGWLVGNSSLE